MFIISITVVVIIIIQTAFATNFATQLLFSLQCISTILLYIYIYNVSVTHTVNEEKLLIPVKYYQFIVLIVLAVLRFRL